MLSALEIIRNRLRKKIEKKRIARGARQSLTFLPHEWQTIALKYQRPLSSEYIFKLQEPYQGFVWQADEKTAIDITYWVMDESTGKTFGQYLTK